MSQCDIDGCSVSCNNYCKPCDSCYRGWYEIGCGGGGTFCSQIPYPEIFPTTYTYSDMDSPGCNPNTNADNTWCAETNSDPNSYVELDLGQICEIPMVAGKGVRSKSSWVTLYRIQYSTDGSIYPWYPYTMHYRDSINYGAEYSEYPRVLSPPLYARYLRFTPLAFMGSQKAMGFRAYGECSNFTLQPSVYPTSSPITIDPSLTTNPTSPTSSPTDGYVWHYIKREDIVTTSELNVNTRYLSDKNGNLIIELLFNADTDNHYAAVINNAIDGNVDTVWSMIRYKQEFHGLLKWWSILGNTEYGLYNYTNIGLYEFNISMDTLIDSDILFGSWNDYETKRNTSNFWHRTSSYYYNLYRGYIIVEQRRMLDECFAGIYVGGKQQWKYATELTTRFSDIAVRYYSTPKPTYSIVPTSSPTPITVDPTQNPTQNPSTPPTTAPTTGTLETFCQTNFGIYELGRSYSVNSVEMCCITTMGAGCKSRCTEDKCLVDQLWGLLSSYTEVEPNTVGSCCTPTPVATVQPTPMPTSIVLDRDIYCMRTNPPQPTVNPTFIPTNVPTNTPTYIPTNPPQTTLNPTFVPTNVPTNTPTYIPTNPPQPTVNPTFIPTINPTAYPTVAVTETTFMNWTYSTDWVISVSFDECSPNKDKCDINETKITEVILIAFIDYNVNVLSTDVIDYNFIVTLSIGMDEYNKLNKDDIARDIEKGLEDEYGDIDIEVTIDDDNEDQTSLEKNPISSLFDEYGPIIIGGVIGTVSFIVIGVVSYCIVLLYRKKKKHIERDQQNMIAMDVKNETGHNNIALATHDDGGVKTDEECMKDNGIDENDSDDNDSMYDYVVPVATATGTTKQ